MSKEHDGDLGELFAGSAQSLSESVETSMSTLKTKMNELNDFLEQNVSEEEAISYIEWMRKKAELKFLTSPVLHEFPVLYGGIYWAYLGSNVGSEEDKHRPVVIVRAEAKSTIAYVVPLTTKCLEDDYWYHIDLSGFENTALVEQFRPIAKQRIDRPLLLKGQIARITTGDMNKIHSEITRMFGRPKKTKPKK